MQKYFFRAHQKIVKNCKKLDENLKTFEAKLSTLKLHASTDRFKFEKHFKFDSNLNPI